MKDALEVTVMCSMQEYAMRRQSNIEEYIATRMIYGLYTGEGQLHGTRWLMRWWDQDHIYKDDANVASIEEVGEV